jgi:putative membrane protein insertion efficiency factor
MKKVFILIVETYQKIFSPLLHQLLGVGNACRFSVTCSEYAKTQILNKGVIKGSFLSLVRLAKCQPFYRSI